MSDKPAIKSPEEIIAEAHEQDIKDLAKAAPQIFKRNGTVKKCPRNLTIKTDFPTMLKQYNTVRNGVIANEKYQQESSISFCAKGVSVTFTGRLAVAIALNPRDILADVIGNGWVIC